MGRAELLAENRALKAEVAKLTWQLEELKRLIYGARQERHISATDSQQLPLFDEPKPEEVEEKTPDEEITYTRKKKKHQGRNEFPEHLPVNVVVVEPEEDTSEMVLIGKDIVKTLDYIPGSLVVNQYEFPKYTTKQGDGVIRAKMPSRPIEKGIPEAGLLAHIIIQKFVYHMPFYRTIARFKQLYSFNLAKSTVNDWFIAVCTLMDPLYERLKKKLLESTYIQADESPVKVLDSDKPGSTHQGYQWVYYAPDQELVLFNYQKGRGKNGPKQLLADYSGYLQTDGYIVYDKITKELPIELFGCMAHARRYFIKAQDNDAQRAEVALNYFKRLYAVERRIREEDLSPDQIRQRRAEKSRPVLDALIAWAGQQRSKVAPKSPIGKALTYLTLQWPKLVRYLEDGRLLIDNNLIENSIRPLALGRKNYLFAGSHPAGRRIAMMYSFLATCKRADVNPFLWLTDVLKKLPEHPVNRLDELLPAAWAAKQAAESSQIPA